MLLPAVEKGYEITLGLTNIGFVLAIIGIAFATILRRENFAMKAALPRLIIIAILMNFGQFFALSIVHVANAIGNGLRDSIFDSSLNLATNLGSFFTANSGSINFGIDLSFIPLLGDILNFLINGIIGVLVLVIFGIIFFFAIVSTAVMLMVRYIAINFLIIALPIALLSHVFPNLSVAGTGGNLWDKWLGKFTEYVIFYPAAMFFLAIAAKITEPGGIPVVVQNTGGPDFSGLGNLILVAGIILGGLKVSSSLGLAGAKSANQLGAWATRKALPTRTLGKGMSALGRRMGGGAAGAAAAAAGAAGAPRPSLTNQLAGAPKGVPTPQFIDHFGQYGGEPGQPIGGGTAAEQAGGGETATEKLVSAMEKNTEAINKNTEGGGTAGGQAGGGSSSEAQPETTQAKVGRIRGAWQASGKKLEGWGGKTQNYAAGGATLGGILKDSVKGKMGVFEEFGSTEGGKALKKQKDDLESAQEKLLTMAERLEKHEKTMNEKKDAGQIITPKEMERGEMIKKKLGEAEKGLEKAQKGVQAGKGGVQRTVEAVSGNKKAEPWFTPPKK